MLGGSVVSGDDRAGRVPEDDAVFQKVLANGKALFDGKVAACKI